VSVGHLEHPGNANCTHVVNIINGGYDKLPDSLFVHCQLIRLSEELFIATVGGEPCYGIKRLVSGVLSSFKTVFIGYTDSCAYVVDDKILSEGGYEATCHLEYGLKGPFKCGIDSAFKKGFEKSLLKFKS
jgi:hypothetical protein